MSTAVFEYRMRATKQAYACLATYATYATDSWHNNIIILLLYNNDCQCVLHFSM